MCRTSGVQTLLLFFFHAECRQRQNRNRLLLMPPFPLSNMLGRGIPVHHRHMHIHQDQLVVSALESFERRLSIFCMIDLAQFLLKVRANKERLSAESSTSKILKECPSRWRTRSAAHGRSQSIRPVHRNRDGLV